ncbi:MAG: ribonuclease R [Bacteroidales bacterium]|nr:ribonuclease R [Bacteroidales bacterium]
MSEKIEIQILKVFANNPFTAFNHKQVSSRVGAYDKGTRQMVQMSILEMAENGILIEESRGKYKINPKHINDDLLPKNYLVGTIDMKQTGKAYVIPQEEGREDVMIAPNYTHHALHGDLVKVLMFPQRKMHKPEGQVTEILQRAKSRFVGRIRRQGNFAFLLPDNRNMVVDIFIPLADLADAENGEKVLVEMTDWPDNMNNPVGKVVKRLGRPGDNNVEMQSILAEYDFPLEFPKGVEAEAAKVKEPGPKDFEGRRDFRKVTTFTIDPSDAKDFDDALSFQRLPDGNVEVGVHIADVSHYVKPGTQLDREAYERGTSVYLVDRTIPMLPEVLCNNVCSLRQDEDKLCFSAVFEMNDKAEVLKQWFGKSVIRSNRRLSYEEAQAIIESGEMPARKSRGQVSPEQAILELHKLATIMRAARYKDGAINFESQEVKFQLDENAKPIGVYIKESKEANWLIEEFMLLANKRVAEYVGARKKDPKEKGKKINAKTFVYRVHDEPNPEKLNTFVEFVTKLGFKMQVGSRKALASSYNKLFKDIEGRGEEYMIDSIAIRTMAKAYYSTENIGHYGLAFPFYTHFTSPIRRYPDLMVHRLLALYLGGGPSANADEYEEYCRHCSIMEKKAADAERSSVKYKQAEFLSDKVGQVFPALISGVSKWGIYAEIEGNKCEGMIPIGTLKGDYYMLDEDNYQVIGRRFGHCYKLGDSVTIRVKGVDMLKKLIDFELVEEGSVRRDDMEYLPDVNPRSKRQERYERHKASRSTSKKNTKPTSRAGSQGKRRSRRNAK